MHELSLADGILRMVEAVAARENFLRVAKLRLEIGALAGVELHALRFALTAMVSGTCLEDGEITIDEVPGLARCLNCRADVEVASFIEPCPICGSHALQTTGGTGLRVMDLLVFNE